MLTSAQEAFGYLTEDVLMYIARQLKLPFSWVYGVATFYHFFSLKPKGEHNCIVCMGTACYVGKGNEILETLEKEFGIDPDGGEAFHGVIKAGGWFGATVDDPRSYSLVGCTVAPGFEYDDFELGGRDELLRRYPLHADVIERLTH